MPKIFEIAKPAQQTSTLPNTAFMKVDWYGTPAYILPTDTPDHVVATFWRALNLRDTYYGTEMLFPVSMMPELGFESDDFYCVDGVNGWYILGPVQLFGHIQQTCQANFDYFTLTIEELSR